MRNPRKLWLAGTCVVVLCGAAALLITDRTSAQPGDTGAVTVPRETPGALHAMDKEGKPIGLCPLKHTDVQAEISGFVARVEVTQKFHNPFDERIEAVYTFPLSQNAAVDDMLMKVGKRTIRGKIKERGEARRIYEAAKQAGHVASLLDQERPNIFTQSVANIMPGEHVDITIRYVELLKFEDAWFEFVFPTVVGPRYIPGAPTSKTPQVAPQNQGRVVEVPGPKTGKQPKGAGWAPDTDQVPDASRITPPVTAPGTRAGHDISVAVEVDAGAPIRELESRLHEVETEREGEVVSVRLKDKETIPNKDFILRYTAATDDIGDSVLTHASELGSFFTLVLQPPERLKPEQITPKEMVFVLDTSGSMSGNPIEKAKETMMYCLDNLNPKDTFNFITFAGGTRVFFDKPVPATPENVGRVQEYLASRKGGGGTEMMKAIRAALDPSDSQEHLRIVCFMTDGYVGNDMAIVDEIQRHPNARIFSFGIGNSVNRFLLDNMARAGRGEVDYVALNADGEKVATRFYERLRNPVLTDIEIDWGNLPVTDIYPKRILDLFSAKPVVVYGRGTRPARGTLTLRGKAAGKPFERAIKLHLPGRQPEHEVLGALWARANIEDLMAQDWAGIQRGQPRAEVKEAIIDLGLRFRVVTQFTSFVAVEEMIVTEGDTTRTIAVPVEMPEGVSYEGVFGEKRMAGAMFAGGLIMTRAAPTAMPGGMGGMGMAGPAGPVGPDGAKGDVINRVGPAGPTVQPPKDMTPEQKREFLLKQKLHKDLQGLAEKVEKDGKDGSLKVGRVEVKNGVVEVSVWLTDDSDENIEKIKALGFSVLVQAKSVRMLVGKIPVAKLKELALLQFVRYVEPPPA